jgi:transcriptional regulator of acetoin/glycerol metabolism
MLRDLELRRKAIERAKADLSDQSSAAGSSAVDPVVRASWQRCAPRFRGSDPDGAPVDASDDARGRWTACPMRHAVPDLTDQLEQIATAGDLIACISDADGRILWQTTPRWLRPGSERIGLLPGGMWHEGTSGTNGIGLALAADRPTTVFATEHWLSPVHDWVCYAAPVHAPDGTQVGAIDLSTTWRHANPLALATVTSIARVVEHEMRLDQPGARLLAPALDLHVLGQRAANVHGQPLRLTQRQFEILTILSVSETATLDELHARLYGDRPVSVATLKAEMSRLRRTLEGALTSRPYRLTLPCRVDAVQLLQRLDTGDVDGAAALYAGQLLPNSEAPFIAEHRHHLDVALRTALLRRGTVSAALRYSAVHPYDIEVLERAQILASADDPLVPALTARLSVAATA